MQNLYYLCTIITFIFNNNNRILHPTKHILFPSIQGGVRGKLCDALREVGYFDHQKDHYFTKREIALLFEFIGDPAA